MLISDGGSDVFSSDLGGRADRGAVRNPDQARISTAAARGDGACGRGPDGGGARLAAAGNLFGRPAVKRRAWPLALLAPLLVGAEKPTLVPDVSQRDIEIAYSFTGADLLLFGAKIGRASGRERVCQDV